MDFKSIIRQCTVASFILQIFSTVTLVAYFILHYTRTSLTLPEKLLIVLGCLFSHVAVVCFAIARYFVLRSVFARLIRPRDTALGRRVIYGIIVTSVFWTAAVAFRQAVDLQDYKTLNGKIFIGISAATCLTSIVNFRVIKSYLNSYMDQIVFIRQQLTSRRTTVIAKPIQEAKGDVTSDAGISITIFLHKITGAILMTGIFVSIWILNPWSLVAYVICSWIFLYGNYLVYKRFVEFLQCQSKAHAALSTISTDPQDPRSSSPQEKPFATMSRQERIKRSESTYGSSNIVALPSELALAGSPIRSSRPERASPSIINIDK